MPPPKTPSLPPQAVRDLKRLLGPQATDIIDALQNVLVIFADTESRIKRDTHAHELEFHLGPLRSLVKAIRVLQDDLSSVPADEQPVWRGDMDRLFLNVVIHIATIEHLFPYARSRGRRRNEERRWLANHVANLLRRFGFSLTKTHGGGVRGGVFYFVLNCVIEAAEGSTPQHLYPLVAETVDLFDHFLPQFLDEVDPQLLGYLRLPK